jgi:hypothetical protein
MPRARRDFKSVSRDASCGQERDVEERNRAAAEYVLDALTGCETVPGKRRRTSISRLERECWMLRFHVVAHNRIHQVSRNNFINEITATRRRSEPMWADYHRSGSTSRFIAWHWTLESGAIRRRKR